MKNYIWPLIMFAISLVYCGLYVFTKNHFWLVLTAIVVVVVVSFVLFLWHNRLKTKKMASRQFEASQDYDHNQEVSSDITDDTSTKLVKEVEEVKEKTALEPIQPKPEDIQRTGTLVAPFPQLQSEFLDGNGLKQRLEEIRDWCLRTSESQLNPNDKRSIDMLFEQLKDCVDCQIALDSVKSCYTDTFIKELKSTEPMDNPKILRGLVQLAMLMIDLSQMAHIYGSYHTSNEDRLWFNVLQGKLSMEEAMKKARKVDDNPTVTAAQYRNLKTFLKEYADISEEGFRIYNGYIL